MNYGFCPISAQNKHNHKMWNVLWIMQNGGTRREMSQETPLMYLHMEQSVNGEEMLQTLVSLRKNNRSQCLNFVCLIINMTWKFFDFIRAKSIVSVSGSDVEDGAVSTACAAYKNIFAPLSTFCSLFCAAVDFPKKQPSGIFMSETNIRKCSY